MTIAVLVPTHNHVRLYLQRARGPVRSTARIRHTDDLEAWIDWLEATHDPLLVAQAGGTLPPPFLDAILERTDLLVIPDPWLQTLPRNATARRARRAAHLTRRHQQGPFHLYLGRPSFESVPF
jgi:hypothetical protein